MTSLSLWSTLPSLSVAVKSITEHPWDKPSGGLLRVQVQRIAGSSSQTGSCNLIRRWTISLYRHPPAHPPLAHYTPCMRWSFPFSHFKFLVSTFSRRWQSPNTKRRQQTLNTERRQQTDSKRWQSLNTEQRRLTASAVRFCQCLLSVSVFGTQTDPPLSMAKYTELSMKILHNSFPRSQQLVSGPRDICLEDLSIAAGLLKWCAFHCISISLVTTPIFCQRVFIAHAHVCKNASMERESLTYYNAWSSECL